MLRANKIPVKSVEEMRDFLKAADPRFATDDYLDGLSYEELCEYYCGCVETMRPDSDDWSRRLDCVRTNNM